MNIANKNQETMKRALQTIVALLASAAVVVAIGYLLLGGKECIDHIKPVKPSVEARYRFDDRNAKHLAHAKRIGIKPLSDKSQIAGASHRLRRLGTCRYYIITSYSHSHPYLVPEAARLLDDIGRDFQERLTAEGYHPHAIVVTSLLRTKADVKRLMRVNNAAVSNSAHLNGTTFDISYARFAPWFGKGKTPSRNQLASALGKTLCELRRQGRCSVKYEHSTNCYHITVKI